MSPDEKQKTLDAYKSDLSDLLIKHGIKETVFVNLMEDPLLMGDIVLGKAKWAGIVTDPYMVQLHKAIARELGTPDHIIETIV